MPGSFDRRFALAPGLWLAALMVGLAPLLARAQAQERKEAENILGVVYADGRQTEDIKLFRLEPPSEELFISAYDLARIFRATRYWNPGARKLVLTIEKGRYTFTLDTRVVVCDDEPVLMRMPVRYSDGQVMIPVEFISAVLSPRLREKAEMDEQRLVLTLGSPRYNVTDIEFLDDEAGSRAVLTLTEELLYHVDSETPGLLRLKIYGGRLNELKFSSSQATGLFNMVRAEQTGHDSYLFFDVKRTASRFRVEFVGHDERAPGMKRLVIFLEKGDLPEIPEAEYANKRMTEIVDDGAAPKKRAVARVTIDAGHGGIDMGKVSPGGFEEKGINLEVALLLEERLEEELGVEVVMTRTEDLLVPLSRRAEIANSEGSDLFISIHCNGWFHPDAGGFETFFLSAARSEEDMNLAREENSSLRYENPGLGPSELEDLDFILWDMVQNEYISESSEFAELLQRELNEVLDIRNRGVKQAGLLVLKGLKMPAVLVEIAFLSNPREEELLADPLFRADVVRGIVEAVRRYQSRRSPGGGM